MDSSLGVVFDDTWLACDNLGEKFCESYSDTPHVGKSNSSLTYSDEQDSAGFKKVGGRGER